MVVRWCWQSCCMQQKEPRASWKASQRFFRCCIFHKPFSFHPCSSVAVLASACAITSLPSWHQPSSHNWLSSMVLYLELPVGFPRARHSH